LNDGRKVALLTSGDGSDRIAVAQTGINPITTLQESHQCWNFCLTSLGQSYRDGAGRVVATGLTLANLFQQGQVRQFNMSYLSSKIIILHRQELVRRDVAYRTTDDNVESQGCSSVTHGQNTSYSKARGQWIIP
jgi:hypothetical protein